MRKTTNDKILQVIIHIIYIIFCFFCLVPLLAIVATSLSDETEVIVSGYSLFPRKFSFLAYQYVFEDMGRVIKGYTMTIATTALGTIFGVSFMTLTAYTLSRSDFKYRSTVGLYIYLTMLFSGGMVPSYILITKYLHMGDTLWVLFVPTIIMPYYIFIMRRFLSDIPMSIIESVKIDGASEYTIFARIVVPLGKSGIAAISLLLVLMYWNSWWPSLMYIDDERLVTLQFLLYKIMSNVQAMSDSSRFQSTITFTENLPTLTLRMALCVVAIGPALMIFPFFQKYFVKGLTAGAVKG